MTRDFVNTYKLLEGKLSKYKEWCTLEHEVKDHIIDRFEKTIQGLEDEVNEYKLALKIPRMHYKHLEKLKFDEMKK